MSFNVDDYPPGTQVTVSYEDGKLRVLFEYDKCDLGDRRIYSRTYRLT